MPDYDVAPSVRFIAVAPRFMVPDVVKAAEYYRDVLGFEIVGFLQHPPVLALVSRDDVEIHFGKGKGPAGTGSPRSREDLDAYIWVGDVDVLAQELKGRGARIVEGPVDRDYGMREIIIQDMHGFRITFGSHPGTE
jgi:catechol 2,3-dioxygenase-like lactoylglutathione lyase family enzyme